MIDDFLKYEFDLGSQFLIPLLKKLNISLDDKSVLDVGCGYGGVLSALQNNFKLEKNLGIDVDGEMIQAGLDQNKVAAVEEFDADGHGRKRSGKLNLRVGNFFEFQDVAEPGARAGAGEEKENSDGEENEKFDFILMRDVLEHIIDVEKALQHAAFLLKPGGSIFVSFAPFYSPFGGHQHNAAGFFSNIPWLQFLPEATFRRLLKLAGNSYKSEAGLNLDMETVLKTRLTLVGFKKSLQSAGLEEQYRAGDLVRPDYQIKFGLPTVALPDIVLSGNFLGPLKAMGEWFCTGFEAVLKKRE